MGFSAMYHINPGLHCNISADTHLLLKQTCKTQLKGLFCVVVGTKGLNRGDITILTGLVLILAGAVSYGTARFQKN